MNSIFNLTINATKGLHHLYEIFRCLFYLNKSSLLDILLSDDLIMDVIGCLEHDPNKPDAMRHREYITTKSKFKEIISFENTDLVNKIHQTYKVQYIQDVILPAPSVFEENSLTSLTSYIFLNKVEISNLIQDDERFLNELFENLKNVNLELEKRQDMLQFLREFTSFLHGLQQTREPFFKSLYDHGILDVIEIALSIKDEKVNTVAVDILSHFVEVSPTLVREYILNEIESKSSVNNLSMSLKTTTTITTTTTTMSNSGATSAATVPSTTMPCASLASSSSSLLSPGAEACTVSSTTTSASVFLSCAKQANPPSYPSTPTHPINAANNSRDESTKLGGGSGGANIVPLADILNTDDVFEPVLINYVIRQMINDPDPGKLAYPLPLLSNKRTFCFCLSHLQVQIDVFC